MQALILRQRVGCTEVDRKSWERKGILVALKAGSGAGIHAQYDDANVITAAIALEMKCMGITVSRYSKAFSELHAWLRNRSSLDWPRYRVVMTPEQAHFQRTGEPLTQGVGGFTLDFGSLCARLFTDECIPDPQIPLPFSLSTIR